MIFQTLVLETDEMGNHLCLVLMSRFLMPFWQAGSKSSADTHAVVKKRPGLVCWSCVAAQKQTVESSKQTQDMENKTDTNVKTVKVIDEAAAEVVAIELRELNLQESDEDDADRKEKESALNETDDEEAMELLETLTGEAGAIAVDLCSRATAAIPPRENIAHGWIASSRRSNHK